MSTAARGSRGAQTTAIAQATNGPEAATGTEAANGREAGVVKRRRAQCTPRPRPLADPPLPADVGPRTDTAGTLAAPLTGEQPRARRMGAPPVCRGRFAATRAGSPGSTRFPRFPRPPVFPRPSTSHSPHQGAQSHWGTQTATTLGGRRGGCPRRPTRRRPSGHLGHAAVPRPRTRPPPTPPERGAQQKGTGRRNPPTGPLSPPFTPLSQLPRAQPAAAPGPEWPGTRSRPPRRRR